MSINFKNWTEFCADGASVPFYKKTENGINFIGFQTTSCTPPGPMVNAFVALNMVKDQNTKVIMINHKFPAGLIPKIQDEFDYETKELADKSVEIIFSLKNGVTPTQKDTNVICHG